MSSARAPLLRVNGSSSAVDIDYGDYLRPCSISTATPIDSYFSFSKDYLLDLSGRYQPGEKVGVESLLVIISAAEYYLREVLSRIVVACPIAESAFCRQQVSVGSLRYYRDNRLVFSALEGKSLADASEIKKKINAFTGVEIKQGSDSDAAIKAFDKVCQLRHCAVHSRGELSWENLSELGVNAADIVELSFDLIGFQNLLMVCHNFVRSINNHLANEIAYRWIDQGILVGDFDIDQEKVRLLYSIFYSKTELGRVASLRAFYQVLRQHVARRRVR